MDDLLSMEKLDRASPEMWPEKSKFYSSCALIRHNIFILYLYCIPKITNCSRIQLNN